MSGLLEQTEQLAMSRFAGKASRGGKWKGIVRDS